MSQMVTQNYDLSMIPGQSIVYVNVSQNDIGRQITFRLLNGSNYFSPPAGATATVEGTKPDGTSFSVAATLGTISASFITSRSMCAVPGQTRCEIRIKYGTEDIGSAKFVLNVEGAGASGGTGPEYQSKTVNPSTSQQVVTPDTGYDALSSVTVNAVALQSKSVTPTSEQQVVEPDSGYMGLSSVTVGAGGGGTGSIDLLWTNSSPASGMNAQTISLDLSGYDAVIIESKGNYSRNAGMPGYRDPASGTPYNQIFNNRVYLNKNESGYLLLGGDVRYPGGTSSAVGSVMWRDVSVSDTGVTFGAGYNNDYSFMGAAVPQKIYGVKGTLPTT